jgi:hypothetical protein
MTEWLLVNLFVYIVIAVFFYGLGYDNGVDAGGGDE